MDYVWEIVQPWVTAIVAALGGSGVVYAIVRALIGKVLRKNNAMLDANYNADKVSQLTAEKLAGKTLNIDVTAVTEKALKKTAKQLDERVEKVEDIANSLKGILAAIGKGIIKLKALSKEEVAELAAAIKELENGYKPPEKDEVMTVMLEPLVVSDDKRYEDGSSNSGLNFGGLETK